MRELGANHYEAAFGNWLADNGVRFVAIDQQKRKRFALSNIKSFDFLIYPPYSQIMIAEVKGRTFKGATLANLTGLDCWVTMDDCIGLEKWRQVFGAGHEAVFVFAYQLEKIDVDPDGRKVYEFDGRRYVFFYIRLGDYRARMKVRSPKWQTVTLGADSFRAVAVELEKLVF